MFFGYFKFSAHENERIQNDHANKILCRKHAQELTTITTTGKKKVARTQQTRDISITSSLVIIILLAKIIRLVSSVALMKFAIRWNANGAAQFYISQWETKGSANGCSPFNSFWVLYFYCFVGMTSQYTPYTLDAESGRRWSKEWRVKHMIEWKMCNVEHI